MILPHRASIKNNIKKLKLKENDIVFFAPNTIHSGDAQTEGVRTHAITFDPSLLGDIVDYSNTADSYFVFKENKEVNESFDKVFDAYHSKKPTADIHILSLVLLSPFDNNFLMHTR